MLAVDWCWEIKGVSDCKGLTLNTQVPMESINYTII